MWIARQAAVGFLVVGMSTGLSIGAGVGLPEAGAAELLESSERLAGTGPLSLEEPLDELMVRGIGRHAQREIESSPSVREAKWKRDYGSHAAYDQSVADNRHRFRTIIGAVDPRVDGSSIELVATTEHDSVVARGGTYTVHAVRWQVLDGVTAEGLLFEPQHSLRARVVALPDADWTPEAFAGLTEAGGPPIPVGPIPVRLAESGVQVLVPTLISRADTFSGNPQVKFTNQPHREFIYRMAFQMGRHVIGYEVQKVLAAVDLFSRRNETEKVSVPIGVVGVGEGGLLALYSAAVDTRIAAAMVSGYFRPREGLWREPIYRNVWSLLSEFGDAEIAGLVAPRSLVIEACAAPEVDGPPPPRSGRGGAAPGRIANGSLESVRSEYGRAKAYYQKLGVADRLVLVASDDGRGPAGSPQALGAFLKGLGLEAGPQPGGGRQGRPSHVDPGRRQQRQFDELVEFTQKLLLNSEKVRDKFWAKADRSSVEAWAKSAGWYRDYVWEELIGKLPAPTLPANPRTRLILDEPKYRAYEVLLDVDRDVIAGGILVVPNGLEKDQRRPVVVCQHGLEGIPMDTITAEKAGFNYYKSFAAELARRGFVTYAPQNPYRGKDRFRSIQRKANPMKRSLFSYIIRQHEQTLQWLSTLAFVDPERIGFYGLSYGGKTAVRVPPILPQYALSICSADFNEWIKKNVSNEHSFSYVFTGEYEMFEWNMGHVANYAELATLMTPRPFMVERGHRDGVSLDEWVAWEYAKVRRHYDELGIGDRTRIEFFNGPHTINGQGTYEFLHRHLKWPVPGE